MSLTATGKKRLLKLAAFLEKLPAKKFNLNVVVEGEGLPNHKTKECGATACAIGWCPRALPNAAKYIDDNVVPIGCLNSYQSYEQTGMELFDITYDQSDFLFSPSRYPESHRSNKYVAARIKTFVKTDGRTTNIDYTY